MDVKLIPLTQGKFAIVDDGDFERLNQFKWCVSKQHRCVYAIRGTERGGIKKTIKMHREILGLISGDGLCADHINSDGLDNRRSNLRVCDKRGNARNQRARAVRKSSRYKGVHWASRTKKWSCEIKCNGKKICLGCFRDESEAAKAYDAKAQELFGEFAKLNFARKGKGHEYQVA